MRLYTHGHKASGWQHYAAGLSQLGEAVPLGEMKRASFELQTEGAR